MADKGAGARDRAWFVDDVFIRPSIGKIAGWIIGILVGLILFLAIEYAPEAAQRAEKAHGADEDGVIPVWASYLTLLIVAVLAVLTGIEPIIAAPLSRWWQGIARRFGSPQRPIWRIPFLVLKFGLGWPLWLIYCFPSTVLSFVDTAFVRVIAVLAGANLQPWPLRYGALAVWMIVVIYVGWVASPEIGMAAIALGLALIFGIVRRWQWVERDREGFLVERQQPTHTRIGFEEDLRDEALISIVFLFVLVPLGLRQVDLAFDAFDLVAGEVLPDTPWEEFWAWLGFFGGELTKAVPLVDWSEVFHVANGSALKPKTGLGAGVVFFIRASMDLLLIAAVLQAVQIASRLRDQQVAFFESKTLKVLDPFAERSFFLNYVSQDCDGLAFLGLRKHPSVWLNHSYETERLWQIVTGRDKQGQSEKSKIRRDPVARSAAVLSYACQARLDDVCKATLTEWLSRGHDLNNPLLAARMSRVGLMLAQENYGPAETPLRAILEDLPDDAYPDTVMIFGHACSLYEEMDSQKARFAAVAAQLSDQNHVRFVRMAGESSLSDAPAGFATIPAGTTFWMGSERGQGDSDEHPRHKVTIRHGFAIARTAVTFDDYDAFCRATGRPLPPDWGWGRGRRPVTGVSHYDATAFCEWLQTLTGEPYRLPSEAEWECACRAGSETLYAFGDDENDLGQYAWFRHNSGGQTRPVAEKLPNEFGLFDMHGNVWEWCADDWNRDYMGAPDDGSAWLTGKTSISVVRGGSWSYFPNGLRSALRNYRNREYRYVNLGFRLARTLPR